MIATLGRFAREQVVELVAATAAAAFLLSGRVTWRTARNAIDLDLLTLLFALLVTVEILRQSGWLDAAVARAVTRLRSARAFAAASILASGLLAMLVTNDVALFVVIPVTIIASRMSRVEVENTVVLQVISANLLGSLTPLGNPQNLFIYHQARWSAGEFIAVMAPFVAWSFVGISAATLILTKAHPIALLRPELPARHAAAGLAGAICFVLVVLDVLHLIGDWIAALAAAAAGIVYLGRRMAAIDLSIIPLFFFAFIIVEGLRSFDVVAFIDGSVYVTSILLSQVISNVPAAILLSPIAEDGWKPLLYGVNAGGCGTIIASLANLLGWRIYVRESNRDARFLWRLTAINFAFLAWAAVGGWRLLK